jgi:hypothetical protein
MNAKGIKKGGEAIWQSPPFVLRVLLVVNQQALVFRLTHARAWYDFVNWGHWQLLPACGSDQFKRSPVTVAVSFFRNLLPPHMGQSAVYLLSELVNHHPVNIPPTS